MAKKKQGEQNIAIEIKDLEVSYKVMTQISLLDPFIPSRRKKRAEEGYFKALRGITFSVNKGEIVGIVGQNGSGKSTLLRTISGTFSPDVGSVNLFGNSVSLLAVGVGFQPSLTGKDNIFLSGLLLGFSKDNVQQMYEEIVEFSELGEFIDKPVNTYSSGMHSKLAFAITAVLETDIILVDEVLSVGDARFRKKSFAKMKELIEDDNRTVLIVSHSSDQIRQLCTKAVWVDAGKVVQQGDVTEVMDAYDKSME